MTGPPEDGNSLAISSLSSWNEVFTLVHPAPPRPAVPRGLSNSARSSCHVIVWFSHAATNNCLLWSLVGRWSHAAHARAHASPRDHTPGAVLSCAGAVLDPVGTELGSQLLPPPPPLSRCSWLLLRAAPGTGRYARSPTHAMSCQAMPCHALPTRPPLLLFFWSMEYMS